MQVSWWWSGHHSFCAKKCPVEEGLRKLRACASLGLSTTSEHPCIMQVSSNLPTLTSPLFSRSPVPFSLSQHVTNQRSLAAAVDAAAAFLNKVCSRRSDCQGQAMSCHSPSLLHYPAMSGTAVSFLHHLGVAR